VKSMDELDKLRFKVISNTMRKFWKFNFRIIAVLFAANGFISIRIRSHLAYHAHGKDLEKHVILNWWHCDQIWDVALYMFMPIHNTITPLSQRVSELAFYKCVKFKTFREKVDT
jgi:hypothetical protein